VMYCCSFAVTSARRSLIFAIVTSILCTVPSPRRCDDGLVGPHLAPWLDEAPVRLFEALH
jgi:hypothetical protein